MKNSNKLGKLFALSTLALTFLTTLSNCGNNAGGGGGITGPTELKAVANGVANQVTISWAAVAGATGYTLYQSTDNLSGFTNADPANLAAANPAAGSSTFSGTVTSTVETLSGADTHYFLITSTQDGVESLTSAAQIAATAHPLEFLTVAGGGTGTFWMDRNLGAGQVATASDDTLAFGYLYQWGRHSDGHQLRGSGTAPTLSMTISPTHAQFITIDPTAPPNDWAAAGVDDDGAQRQALWSRIDGSGICPTGFRVPIEAELTIERRSWSSNNAAGAFASNLKWTTAGFRSRTNSVTTAGGSYWSSSVTVSAGDVLSFSANVAAIDTSIRVNGSSVRCIQN